MQLLVVDAVEVGDLVHEGYVNLVFELVEGLADCQEGLAVEDDAVGQLAEAVLAALGEGDQYGFGELPDRIVLYREPLIDIAEDLDDLKDQIHVTLVHEIAHFYGINDEQLHELGWA